MLNLEIYPPELNGLVLSAIGPFQVIANLRLNSVRTGVWKLSSDTGNKCYYLKTYTRKQRWHPEVFAYTHWTGYLKPYVPELISSFEGDEWQAILITSINGTILREAELSSAANEAAYLKAGELTRVLHHSENGRWFGRPDKNGNPIELYHNADPVQYISNSIIDICKRCTQEGLLQSSEIELTHWALQNTQIFEPAKPVPISWDSTPGNWLVDNNGIFTGMIDFENMLWGIDVDNFSILFGRYFKDNKRAMKAYFEGYGAEILKERNIEVQICCIKMAIGDIYWGTLNKQPNVIHYGRELLHRIYDNNLL
jgi:hypothetical protein